MSKELDRLLSPAKLAGLTLRNRVIKTATFEGMCPDGVPGNDLIDHHAGGCVPSGMLGRAHCAGVCESWAAWRTAVRLPKPQLVFSSRSVTCS